MLKNVEPYGKIIDHTSKVVDSCRTELQLENAHRWAIEITKNFFNKVLAECRHGDAGGIIEIRDRSCMIFQERYRQKRNELRGETGENSS